VRIKKLSQMITILTLSLSAAVIAVTIYSFYLVELRNTFSNNTASAISAGYQLLEGKELLTTSIRQYFSTGQIENKTEYLTELTFTKSREHAIEALMKLPLTKKESELFGTAMEKSNTLVMLEGTALSAADDKNMTLATSIVFGENYQSMNNLIDNTIKQAINSLQDRLEITRSNYSDKIKFSEILAIATNLLNFLTVFFTLNIYLNKKIILPIIGLTKKTRKMMKGDYVTSFDIGADNSEISELGEVLESYRQTREDTQLKHNVIQMLAKLTHSIKNTENIDLFAHKLLEGLQEFLGFNAGLFYLVDQDNDSLYTTATWGIDLPNAASSGEGPAGGLAFEAISSLKTVIIHNIPIEYFKISSGLGSLLPSSLVFIPLQTTKEAIACLELAFFGDFSREQSALIKDLPNAITPYLIILQRNLRTLELLAETKKQALWLTDMNNEQRAIFDSITTGIALLQHRTLLHANTKLEEILGYESGELSGKATTLWFPDDDEWDLLKKECKETIAQNGQFQKELELKKKNGTLFWSRIRARILDKKNDGTRYVCIIEDITEERNASEILRKAKDAAEKATRIKSEFLANMSHEIRTPLNAIIGMSHLAQKTGLTPKQEDYLQKIEISGQHLLGIINDILDISKIEAGKFNIELQSFDLEDMLSMVAGVLNEKAAVKELELVFNIAPEVPRHLIGDSLRLGQILLNYGTNAIKFTERGEICISVRNQEVTQDNVLLYFSVRDTGIGLTPEQKDRLFVSFQQGDMTITKKYGGTGLGLSICRQLANLMDGKVGVESKEHEGSTFWFTARLGLDRTKPPVPMSFQELRKCKALVVDDNKSARMMMNKLLDSIAITTVLAASGKEAIEEFKAAERAEKPFDIIFLDWRMPEMDGLETARKLTSITPEKKLHIVMLTAYDQKEVSHETDAFGIEALLTKPITPSILYETCMVIMGKEFPIALPKKNEIISREQKLKAIEGSRVLLVEDNELNQEVSACLLTEAGMITDVADNGVMALQKIEKKDYDLIFMDMQMPIMDGLTAVREIRKNPAYWDLPIVAMTANAMQQDKEACLEAGMNDLIVKPVEPEKLFNTLISWITPNKSDPKRKDIYTIAPQLLDLLRDNDALAPDFLAENANLIKKTFPEEFNSITTATTSFEFGKASKLLADAIIKAGITQ